VSHAPMLPILIPLLAAIAAAAAHRRGVAAGRRISTVATLALAAAAAHLVIEAADGRVQVYAVGDWAAPYGIVLVVDRLAALMVALVSLLAVPVALAARSVDGAGRHFHALLQLQLMGLNGAFLTGDLVNLFVFFEILLLASYALLVHGHGRERARAGLAYVLLNFAGSALFLMSLGLLYGVLGTLNLADMAVVIQGVVPADRGLVRAAFGLLAVVLALKAALLPLSFWLPRAYSAASPPVAALFAIMTKVGVYALLRIDTLVLAGAGFTAELLAPWLAPLALLTIVLGMLGALASHRLATVVANLVIVSTGILLVAVALREAAGATLYYLAHTTPITAGLFLLAGHVASDRGELRDRLVKGPALRHGTALGLAFAVLGVAAAGVPPLSGFIGKLMLMRSLEATALAPLIWAALLVSGLVVSLVLARAASALFWEPTPGEYAPPAHEPGALTAVPQHAGAYAAPLAILAAVGPLLAAAAAPIAGYAAAAAEQLSAPSAYIGAVLGDGADIESIDRRGRP
jgi:multicomponent K+:H+ antiporter subunit D